MPQLRNMTLTISRTVNMGNYQSAKADYTETWELADGEALAFSNEAAQIREGLQEKVELGLLRAIDRAKKAGL